MDAPSIDEFRSIILDYYREAGRDLPWRHTRDPWAILVSEVMLQQTQTDRVAVYWQRWLERWPTPAALAAASLEEVLAAWSGLGYNRRARFLREAARAVVNEHGATMPQNAAALQTLPGVGPYTAGATACFAYGEPVVIIETNIRAVFLHFFFNDKNDVHDRELFPLIEESLWREDPRSWYYGLMDYGARLKKLRSNPSRQSRHHAKQSRFEGSLREARGNILRALSKGGPSCFEALASYREEGRPSLADSPDGRSRLERALADLIAEGLLEKYGPQGDELHYRIRQD